MVRLLPMLFRMGFRNIFRQRRRSLLTITAVAFGIFCLIVFQALKAGLHRKMIDSALGLDPGAVQIHAAGYAANMALLQPLAEPGRVLRILDDQGLVDRAVRVRTAALLLAGPRSSSVVLTGVDWRQESRVTFLGRELARKMPGPAAGAGGLVLSRVLAETLGLAPGDRVDLLVQDSFAKPVTRRLRVERLYASGLDSFDRTHIYCDLVTARSLLGLEKDDLTEIVVAVDPEEAAAVGARLAGLFDAHRYQVQQWRQFAPDLNQLMELNDATFALLVGIVFAIVALGIANTMTTVVYERFRELGTLAAIGTTPAEIVALIAVESLLLGLIAAVVGACCAILLALWLNGHGIDLTRFTSANQYFASGSVIRAYLHWDDVFQAVALALATALLAGLLPAVKAARLQPARALRFY